MICGGGSEQGIPSQARMHLHFGKHACSEVGGTILLDCIKFSRIESDGSGAVSRIPCEAMRYKDRKWRRGERGSKTARGYFVTFSDLEGEPPQDTKAIDVRLRPNW